MADMQIVRVDQGAVNARILAREVKADFRRVEAASLKMRARFASADGKRLFVRYFSSLQLNVHFMSVIARIKLKNEDVERVEALIREQISAVTERLNKAIDGAEALFKTYGITNFATYDTQALELDVGIISSIGRRYFEALTKFDQLMPLLQTLEIHEVISSTAVDSQRATLKHELRSVGNSARTLARGLRRRMNELASMQGEEASAEPSQTQAPTDGPSQGAAQAGSGERSNPPTTTITDSAP